MFSNHFTKRLCQFQMFILQNIINCIHGSPKSMSFTNTWDTWNYTLNFIIWTFVVSFLPKNTIILGNIFSQFKIHSLCHIYVPYILGSSYWCKPPKKSTHTMASRHMSIATSFHLKHVVHNGLSWMLNGVSCAARQSRVWFLAWCLSSYIRLVTRLRSTCYISYVARVES